jgi:hypothetical protein
MRYVTILAILAGLFGVAATAQASDHGYMRDGTRSYELRKDHDRYEEKYHRRSEHSALDKREHEARERAEHGLPKLDDRDQRR